MKKALVLLMSITLVLSFLLVSCQKQEAPQKEVTTPEQEIPQEPEAPPAAGGYGEEAPETPGYGEEKAPEAGGYGEKTAPGY